MRCASHPNPSPSPSPSPHPNPNPNPNQVRISEERLFGKIVLKALDEEYLRNRTRVTEIWNLVHVVHGEELGKLGASNRDEE